MELVAHLEQMTHRLDTMTAAKNRLVEAAKSKSIRNVYGIFSPELYRAEGACIAEIGGAALDLVKLTPHIPEIYQLRKDAKREL